MMMMMMVMVMVMMMLTMMVVARGQAVLGAARVSHVSVCAPVKVCARFYVCVVLCALLWASAHSR